MINTLERVNWARDTAQPTNDHEMWEREEIPFWNSDELDTYQNPDICILANKVKEDEKRDIDITRRSQLYMRKKKKRVLLSTEILKRKSSLILYGRHLSILLLGHLSILLLNIDEKSLSNMAHMSSLTNVYRIWGINEPN